MGLCSGASVAHLPPFGFYRGTGGSRYALSAHGTSALPVFESLTTSEIVIMIPNMWLMEKYL